MAPLLLINPNTSTSVTALLQKHVAAAAPDLSLRAITARFGAPYIADEASYATGAEATLDAWSAALVEGPAPGAVLIGCFGDPALLALRARSAVPVSGLAEAAFTEAARHGRFGIVTGGERWGPMLRALAQTLGHADAISGIHTVAPSGAALAADPVAAQALLGRACDDAVAAGAQAVIVGGAGLAGYAAALQPGCAVPLIDSVGAGARWARSVLTPGRNP